MGRHNQGRSTGAPPPRQPRSIGSWVGDQGIEDLAEMARSARSANKTFGRRVLSRAEQAGTADTTRLATTTPPTTARRPATPLPRRSATNQPTFPIPLPSLGPTSPIALT